MESSRGLGPGWLCAYCVTLGHLLPFVSLGSLEVRPCSVFLTPGKSVPRLSFSYLDRVLIFLPWANRQPVRMQGGIIHSFLLQLHCHVGRGSIKARLEDRFWDMRWALGQPRPTPSSMSVYPITSCKGQTEEAFYQNTSASHMKHLFIQVNLTQTLQHLSQRVMVWTTQ